MRTATSPDTRFSQGFSRTELDLLPVPAVWSVVSSDVLVELNVRISYICLRRAVPGHDSQTSCQAHDLVYAHLEMSEDNYSSR